MASAEVINFGIQAIMGLSNGYLADANTTINNTLSQANVTANNTINAANTYASNVVRSATNQLKASRGALARYTQSVNNNRSLANMGEQVAASTINYQRAKDSALQSSFEDQIAYAEQAGRQSAQAAFSGLTGGVADIVNGTSELRRSRIEQRVRESFSQADYDASQRTRAIMLAGFDSLDQSEITDELDYNTSVLQQQVAPTTSRNGNWLTDILIGQDVKSLANIASLFKQKE